MPAGMLACAAASAVVCFFGPAATWAAAASAISAANPVMRTLRAMHHLDLSCTHDASDERPPRVRIHHVNDRSALAVLDGHANAVRLYGANLRLERHLLSRSDQRHETEVACRHDRACRQRADDAG